MKRRSIISTMGVIAAGSSGCLTIAESENGTEKPLSEFSCPPYNPESTAVCSHTVGEKEKSVYLLPSSKKIGNGEDIEFTLYNKSGEELEFNPHQWKIHHYSSGNWTKVEKEYSISDKLTVSPHSTHTWSGDEVINSISSSFDFVIGVNAVEIGIPDPINGDWTQCVSLFRIAEDI